MRILKWFRFWFQWDGDRAAVRALRLASYRFRSRDFDGARSVLLSSLQTRKEIRSAALRGAVLRLLYLTWHRQRRYAEAIEFLNGYIPQHPEEASSYRWRAAALWYSDALDEALKDFSRALELNPRDRVSLAGRGQVLVECGKYDLALHDLDSAMELLSKHHPTAHRSAAYARNGRGAALVGLGRIDEGLKEFEESLAVCPNNAWVYFNRAQFYDSRMEYEKAIPDYAASLTKFDPPLNLIKREKVLHRLEKLRGTE